MLSPQVENFGMEIGPGGIIDKPYIPHQTKLLHVYLWNFPQQTPHKRMCRAWLFAALSLSEIQE